MVAKTKRAPAPKPETEPAPEPQAPGTVVRLQAWPKSVRPQDQK